MKMKTILLMIALSLGSANFVNANDDTCQVATALKIKFFQEKVKQGQKRLETLRSKKTDSEELLYSVLEEAILRKWVVRHFHYAKERKLSPIIQEYKEKIAETEKELLSSSIIEPDYKCSSTEAAYLVSFHEIKSKHIQEEIGYKRRELSRLRTEQTHSEERLSSAIRSSQKSLFKQSISISPKHVIEAEKYLLGRHKKEIEETEKDIRSLVLALEAL